MLKEVSVRIPKRRRLPSESGVSRPQEGQKDSKLQREGWEAIRDTEKKTQVSSSNCEREAIDTFWKNQTVS